MILEHGPVYIQDQNQAVIWTQQRWGDVMLPPAGRHNTLQSHNTVGAAGETHWGCSKDVA